MKLYAFFILFLICIASSQALILTNFSDGTSSFQSSINVTKRITIPIGYTVNTATVKIAGQLRYQAQQAPNSSASNGASCVNPTNAYDGNYASFANMSTPASSCYIQSNYTFPAFPTGYKPNATLRYMLGYADMNYNNDVGCLLYNESKLRLLQTSMLLGGLIYMSELYCYFPIGTILLKRQGTGLQSHSRIYDVTVYWKMPLTRFKLFTNTALSASNTNIWNTSTPVSLNVSVINSYISTNRTIPIRFGFYQGNISVSDLSVSMIPTLRICNNTVGDNIVYNFTARNEDNNLLISGNWAVDLVFENTSISFTKNNVKSIALCSQATSITSDGVVYMTTPAYTSKYYLLNDAFTGTTKRITVYNSIVSTNRSSVLWQVKDSYWSAYSNIVGKLSRYYPANHTWNIVQQDKSSEFGQLVYNVLETNTEYKMSFYDTSNNLLYTTDTLKFICPSGLCEVTNQITTPTAAEINIHATVSFSNLTKIATITWNEPTATITGVSISVSRDTLTGKYPICTISAAGASGSATCNASGNTGIGIVTISSTGNTTAYYTSTIDFGKQKLYDFLNNADSAIISFIVLMVIIGFGLTGSAASVIIMTLFGLVFLAFLGLSSFLSISVIGVACTLGIIIALMVRR